MSLKMTIIPPGEDFVGLLVNWRGNYSFLLASYVEEAIEARTASMVDLS